MTFEEFFEHCAFDMQYGNDVFTDKLLVMVLFDNPHGKFWTHIAPVDKGTLLLLNYNEIKKHVAETLFYKLKEIKEI